MSSIDTLPLNLDQDITRLEKELFQCTLTVNGLKELLDLYKGAMEYYDDKNYAKKQEYTSKYKYALNTPYIVKLLSKSADRYLYM